MMGQIKAKTIFAVVVGLYFLKCAYDPSQWHFLDGVNLIIHEAGHVVFMPFGEFVMIAGGSAFQVIVPLTFCGYFLYHRQYFEAALTSFWAGESILNVSVYARDAVTMQLPLLGGSDSLHDWNYLLGRMDLLGSTTGIAGLIRLVGTLVIVAGFAGAIYFSISRRPEARWERPA
jgi:hypothetical protein